MYDSKSICNDAFAPIDKGELSADFPGNLKQFRLLNKNTPI